MRKFCSVLIFFMAFGATWSVSYGLVNIAGPLIGTALITVCLLGAVID